MCKHSCLECYTVCNILIILVSYIYNNVFLSSKTVERRSVSADSSNRRKETKEYLPDWLEPKPISENTDYIQVTPTDEFDRHRSSDKIHEVRNITDVIKPYRVLQFYSLHQIYIGSERTTRRRNKTSWITAIREG